VGDDLARTCRELALLVADLRVRNADYLRRLRARRKERAAWHRLLLDLRRSPDQLVGSCAYCRRLRTPNGVWRTPDTGLRDVLMAQQRLSHTYCDECMHEHGLD
jgi:hypothetical protein